MTPLLLTLLACGDAVPPPVAEETPAAAEAVVENPVQTPAADPVGQWACPMHPEVTASAPGSCPTCGMDLQPVKGEGQDKAVSPGHDGMDHGMHGGGDTKHAEHGAHHGD